MLPVPRTHVSGSRGRESERTVMGNMAVAEELAGSDELEALFELDASEA
jgi:hypothetical protein